MRYETFDMRFLLTVGFSLRNRTDNMKNNEATHAIPSPLAEKVASGGASTSLSASTNRHLMTEEVFLPSSDSGTELPFTKFLLLSTATFSSKRRRNLLANPNLVPLAKANGN